MIIDNLKFYWQYDAHNHTVICIATNLNPDPNPDTEKIIMVAQNAVVSKKDHYNREIGRKISLQRTAAKVAELLYNNPVLQKQFRTRVWEAYRTLTKVPRWSVKQTA